MFKSKPARIAIALQFALLGLPAAYAPAVYAAVQPEANASGDAAIERIVVTASGFEQKVVDAPASISVISGIELQTRPYTTLLDVVRELEGVDIGETRDKTGQGTVSMRGMGSDYTLILIDGRRQNNNGDIYPNSFGGNQFNHIPPLSAVERVEVIRGPASTLYGADALGGVINIITKKITDKTVGAFSHSRTVQSESVFGDDTTTDFSLFTPLLPGKVGLALRGNVFDRDASDPEYAPAMDPDGNWVSRELGFGGGGKTVDNTNWSAGATLNYMPNDKHTVIFSYDNSEQKYDNDGNQLGTEDTFDAMLRIVNAAIQPRAGYAKDQRFGREQWALQHLGEWQGDIRSNISLSGVDTSNLGRTLPYTVAERNGLQGLWNTACLKAGGKNNAALNCVPTFLSGRTDSIKSTTFTSQSEAAKMAFMQANLSAAQYQQMLSYLPRDARTLATNQYTLDAKIDIPFENHMVVTGGQLIDGEMEDSVFGMYGDGYVEGTVQKHEMWALFAEDNWTVLPDVVLTAGIRYDDHNVFGGEVSPRLYSVWTVNPSWTIKGGVSTGYKTPKTSDLFPGIVQFGGQGVSPGVGNPLLTPETSVNTEVAVYYAHDDGHSFNATIFNNRFDDKISNGGDTIPPCDIAKPGQRCADVGAGWADLGYVSFSQKINIDRVDILGAELAGIYQLPYDLTLRANYTLTDSEQKSGASKGLPLTNTARHMANATLDYAATDLLKLFLTAEVRSKRYRGFDATLNKELFYKNYEVFHLGASYKASDAVTFNVRINNLFDIDFTSYNTVFAPVAGGGYTGSYVDDFNNKDKARNLWLSVNVTF
jgi:outer membrane receptor for ferrienterochelin and colicins